jgi:uncharacterized membrane protein (UPF0127 family)
MKQLQLHSSKHGVINLASDLKIAETLVSRTKGLLGKKTLPKGAGLWIKRCNSIHTAFMKFPIDAVFVDANLRVVSFYHGLKPWRITRIHLHASSVFELPTGVLQASGGIQIGEQLLVREEALEGVTDET